MKKEQLNVHYIKDKGINEIDLKYTIEPYEQIDLL